MLIQQECFKECLQHLVTIYLLVNSTFTPIFVTVNIAQSDIIYSRSNRYWEKRLSFHWSYSLLCVCVCVSVFVWVWVNSPLSTVPKPKCSENWVSSYLWKTPLVAKPDVNWWETIYRLHIYQWVWLQIFHSSHSHVFDYKVLPKTLEMIHNTNSILFVTF